MDPAPAQTSRETRQWLRSQIVYSRKWLVIAIGAGMGAGLLIIGQSWIMARVIHSAVVDQQAPAELVPLLGLLLGVFGGRSLLVWLKETAGFQAGAAVRRQVRAALLEGVIARGPAGMARQSTGALVSTVMEQVEGLHDYYALFIPQMVLAALVPSAIIICVFPLTWVAGLILLLTAPLIPLFMVLVGMGAETVSQRHFKALSQMSGYFLDLLQGLPTLKLLGRSRDRLAEIARVSDRYRRRTMAVLRIAFLSSAVLEFFSALAIALVAVYLGTYYLGYVNFGAYGHSITLQTGLYILLLAPEFYAPLRELGTRYHARATALGAAAEIRKVLTASIPRSASFGLPAATHRGTTHEPLPGAAKGLLLALERVTFSYPHRDRPALADVSLEIGSGHWLALVGRSGAGKSTLLNLLLGFLHTDQGTLRVNGRDLSSIDPELWRQQVAWVGQQPMLFSGTLEENIRIGAGSRPPDPQELDAAIQGARVDELLSRLPMGLQTPVGEQGGRLSRGQAQRVALARAMLKQAPLVIMDEPTAGLDQTNERLVMDGIAHLAKHRTVVMATHRWDQLQTVDRIGVLDGGRLVALGPPGQLLTPQGRLQAGLTPLTEPRPSGGEREP